MKRNTTIITVQSEFSNFLKDDQSGHIDYLDLYSVDTELATTKITYTGNEFGSVKFTL